jgi:ATP synthase in type III secretion protein N
MNIVAPPLASSLASSLAARFDRALDACHAVTPTGRVVSVCGTMIKATGLNARIGQACWLHPAGGAAPIAAEVVALDGPHALLMPVAGVHGIGTDAAVQLGDAGHEVAVGDELLGRIVDGNGAPLDDRPAPRCIDRVPLHRAAPSPLQRALIDRALPTGVRAIDSLLTCGIGQRIGIFAAAGGGKSTLLGMLARGTRADAIVIALVGERGREVREFLADNLDNASRARSVLVVATSDRPALERARAVYRATAIAEHFRAQGKHVLLLVDSVTRVARALRDVGLAAGELPSRRGFPPSVFSVLPQLFERAGSDQRGAITAFYTVLVEDEDSADPVAEEVRSLLDGHIVLARALGRAGHYPAIDVLASASRVMGRVTTPDHAQAAQRARQLLARHRDVELLLQMGEYQPGRDALADAAIACHPALLAHLRQDAHAAVAWNEALASLHRAVTDA